MNSLENNRAAWLKQLPNKLTLMRIGAIPLLLILYPFQFSFLNVLCAAIFALAAITDFFDGYLARKYQAVTQMGKLMDPIADKMLVSASLILLASVGAAPAFLCGLLICRDIGVSGLRLVALQEKIQIEVSETGKWKTAMQGVAIFCLLIVGDPAKQPVFDLPFRQVGMITLWSALALSAYSAWFYFDAFWQKAKKNDSGQ